MVYSTELDGTAVIDYCTQIGYLKYEALRRICTVYIPYDDSFGIQLDRDCNDSFSSTAGEPANKRRQ